MKPLLIIIGDSRLRKFEENYGFHENQDIYETHVFFKPGCVLSDLNSFIPKISAKFGTQRKTLFIVAAGINNFTKLVENQYHQTEAVAEVPLNRVRIWRLINDFKEELLKVFSDSIVVAATIPPINLVKYNRHLRKQGYLSPRFEEYLLSLNEQHFKDLTAVNQLINMMNLKVQHGIKPKTVSLHTNCFITKKNKRRLVVSAMRDGLHPTTQTVCVWLRKIHVVAADLLKDFIKQ